jgi:hypothetical protein
LPTHISLAEVTGDNIARLNRIPAWNDLASERHCRADRPEGDAADPDDRRGTRHLDARRMAGTSCFHETYQYARWSVNCY